VPSDDSPVNNLISMRYYIISYLYYQNDLVFCYSVINIKKIFFNLTYRKSRKNLKRNKLFEKLPNNEEVSCCSSTPL